MTTPQRTVHPVMTSSAHVLRRLASNAILFQLEHQIKSNVAHAAVPTSLVVYQMKSILDHMSGVPTDEPIVRSGLTVDIGLPEPVIVEFFDIRFRDWLCLNEPELTPEETADMKVSLERMVMSDKLAPDEHSPVYLW